MQIIDVQSKNSNKSYPAVMSGQYLSNCWEPLKLVHHCEAKAKATV